MSKVELGLVWFLVGVSASALLALWLGPSAYPQAGLTREHAAAEFGHDGTTCYAFKVPQADGLGPHLIFCKDGRYGIHDGAAFMPRLYPEENADG